MNNCIIWALAFISTTMASRTFEVDAKRPYEIVRAQRTADEFPPVARLETADGWSVE